MNMYIDKMKVKYFFILVKIILLKSYYYILIKIMQERILNFYAKT